MSIRGIQARCPGCGGASFHPRGSGELHAQSELACTGCGLKSSYEDLLEQIGQQAMQQANDAIARLKGKKGE